MKKLLGTSRKFSFLSEYRFFFVFLRRKSTKKIKQSSISSSSLHMLPLPLALQYLRAAEVGWPYKSSTVELHLRLCRSKRTVTLKGHLALPHPIWPDRKVCVIAKGDAAQNAKDAGASIVGSDDIIEEILQGRVNFDTCLAHPDAFPLLKKVSQMPGAKRWMPSVRNGTVCSEMGEAVKMMINGVRFKEKDYVIRAPLGKIHFTDSEIRSNLRVFLEYIESFKKNNTIKVKPRIEEIVLSSSHGMGIVLDPRSV